MCDYFRLHSEVKIIYYRAIPEAVFLVLSQITLAVLVNMELYTDEKPRQILHKFPK